MRWTVRDVDGRVAGRIAESLKLHPVASRCLVARGVATEQAARAFLWPKLGELRPPAGLTGLERAVARMARALAAGETIGLFGDYDVDGVTTTALMTSALRGFGAARVVPRVARREAGYGFGVADVDALAGQGATLIITGDCGTSDTAALLAAACRGVDVVVIDHHTVPSEEPGQAHPAHALINPFCPDSTFAFRGMASVGLAFYTMAALRTQLRQQGWFSRRTEPDLRDVLDLVAIGTIADLVPLEHENRILTSYGIARLRERRRPGIDALLARAGIARGDDIDEQTVSWKIAPRLNAPGRLGDAAPSLELLLCGGGEAEACAERLEQANGDRRRAQDDVMAGVDAELGSADPGAAVVVAGAGWPSGVVGIVAARLVDRYRRPAFVIAIDPTTGVGRGSARTAGGIHLYEVLAECAPLLERFGGHAAAAGLTVRADQVPALREALGAACHARAAAASRDPGPEVDAEIDLGDVGMPLARQLRALGPFGRGNPEPRLLSRGVNVASARRVGDGSHLKLELTCRHGTVRQGIAFRQGDREPAPGTCIDLVYRPVVSTFNGAERMELEVTDLAPSAPAYTALAPALSVAAEP